MKSASSRAAGCRKTREPVRGRAGNGGARLYPKGMPLTRIHTSLLNRRYRVAIGLGLLFAPALAAQQSQFNGSVSTGTASSTPLALTLRDAIDRGLRANLGLLVSGSASETARG